VINLRLGLGIVRLRVGIVLLAFLGRHIVTGKAAAGARVRSKRPSRGFLPRAFQEKTSFAPFSPNYVPRHTSDGP
jgi:hypothetical protein